MDLKERLNSVIQKDKLNNPKYLIEVIKSDFYYLINSYFDVDLNDIEIQIDIENNRHKIKIECKGDRMKLMQALPN